MAWGASLPSKLTHSSKASSKEWMNNGRVQSRGFSSPQPVCLELLSLFYVSHIKSQGFQRCVEQRWSRNVCYDIRLGVMLKQWNSTACAFIFRTIPMPLFHKFHGQWVWFQLENTAVVEAENVPIAVAKKLLRCLCRTVIIILLECDHLWIIYPACDGETRAWGMHPPYVSEPK